MEEQGPKQKKSQKNRRIWTKGTEASQEVLEEGSEKVKKVQSSAECKAGSRHPSI